MTNEKNDLGAVSATEGDAVPCLVPTDAASHAALAKRIIDAIPEAFGMTPDPWAEEPNEWDGEPHKTVQRILSEAWAAQEESLNIASKKLHEGTLHVGYCNGNHNERVGKEGMICNCPLGREIQALRRIAKQLVIEAKSATNALACLARAQYHHAEVTRLHIAIDLLNEKLIGYHGTQPLSEAGASAQSEAPK